MVTSQRRRFLFRFPMILCVGTGPMAAMPVAPRPYLLAQLWGRFFHGSVPFGAGHNRWSKVKHHKGKRDGERAQAIQRLSARIRAAVCNGGPDPALNAELAQVVAQCKAKNVPKASIMAAINAAAQSMGQERLVAVRGPGGSSIIIIIRKVDEERGMAAIKGVLQRDGASLSPSFPIGCFEERGLIRTASRSTSGSAIEPEVALDAAITAGAEDVRRDPDIQDGDGQPALQFLCPPSSVVAVGQRLRLLGLLVLWQGVRLVPQRWVALQEEDEQRALNMVRDIRKCHGVIGVIHNFRGEGEGEI